MNLRGFLSVSCAAVILIPTGGLAEESGAYLHNAVSDTPGSAVDANGVRHTQPRGMHRLSPWMQDRLKSVAPDYAYEDRRLHHTGTGWFRLILDLKTGAVTKVTVLKSTGFATLDGAAVAAFRGWRWRPGRWKEIDTPVRFSLYHGSLPSHPPDWIRLPPR